MPGLGSAGRCRGLNPGPPACKVSSLPTELEPQPRPSYFSVMIISLIILLEEEMAVVATEWVQRALGHKALPTQEVSVPEVWSLKSRGSLGLYRGQKRVPYSPGTGDMDSPLSHRVGARNRTWVLRKSSECSYLLSHPSSPSLCHFILVYNVFCLPSPCVLLSLHI